MVRCIRQTAVTDRTGSFLDEIHDIFEKISPAKSVIPLGNVMGFEPPSDAVKSFTFRPGFFQRTD